MNAATKLLILLTPRSREQDLLDQLTNPYDERAETVLDAYLRGIAYSDGRTSALPRWTPSNDNGL